MDWLNDSISKIEIRGVLLQWKDVPRKVNIAQPTLNAAITNAISLIAEFLYIWNADIVKKVCNSFIDVSFIERPIENKHIS